MRRGQERGRLQLGLGLKVGQVIELQVEYPSLDCDLTRLVRGASNSAVEKGPKWGKSFFQLLNSGDPNHLVRNPENRTSTLGTPGNPILRKLDPEFHVPAKIPFPPQIPDSQTPRHYIGLSCPVLAPSVPSPKNHQMASTHKRPKMHPNTKHQNVKKMKRETPGKQDWRSI